MGAGRDVQEGGCVYVLHMYMYMCVCVCIYIHTQHCNYPPIKVITALINIAIGILKNEM